MAATSPQKTSLNHKKVPVLDNPIQSSRLCSPIHHQRPAPPWTPSLHHPTAIPLRQQPLLPITAANHCSASAHHRLHTVSSHFISKPPCVSQTADHHHCFSTACPPRQPNTEAMHHLRKLNDSSENHPKWTEVPTAVSQAAATFLRLITNGRCHLRSTMESICFRNPKQSSSHVTRIYRDTIDICPAT